MTRIEQKSIRPKTRFLNFRFTEKPEVDEQIVDDRCDFEQPEGQNPIGQLVIVEGAGRGVSFSLLSDVVRIGRGDGQDVQLAFGDLSVSRESHATIVYYGERGGFLILDGRKANPVFLNGHTLKEDGCLNHGDLIRIGETTLRFMSHCKV